MTASSTSPSATSSSAATVRIARTSRARSSVSTPTARSRPTTRSSTSYKARAGQSSHTACGTRGRPQRTHEPERSSLATWAPADLKSSTFSRRVPTTAGSKLKDPRIRTIRARTVSSIHCGHTATSTTSRTTRLLVAPSWVARSTRPTTQRSRQSFTASISPATSVREQSLPSTLPLANQLSSWTDSTRGLSTWRSVPPTVTSTSSTRRSTTTPPSLVEVLARSASLDHRPTSQSRLSRLTSRLPSVVRHPSLLR